MNQRRRLSAFALLGLLPLMGTLFWLTAVATSGLPQTAAFVINVHGLTLNDPPSRLRPAPLSLSVLDDAQVDARTATPTPSFTPPATAGGTTTAVLKPTPTPTQPVRPAPTPAPTATSTSTPLPLPTPSLPTPTPSPTVAPGTITGQVVDSQTRTPIAGAAISMTPPAAVGISDSNGNFALIVPPGSYTVTATATGYNSASQAVTVKSGSRQGISFKLTSIAAYGSIAGSVTDANTGTPIAAATITLSDGLVAVSDLNGNYSFAVVLVGTYTITASATGYVSQSQAITVKPGHQTTQNFQLAR